MDMSKRLGAGIALVTVSMLMLSVTAVGQEEIAIEIPLETVVRGAPGSQHLLGSAPVPETLQGKACRVAAISENQVSVHPGNDLVVATNGHSIVLSDVERESGAITVSDEELTMGSSLTVTLMMGPDGVFSAGMVVRLCDTSESTTTTTVESTTTSIAPTTTSPLESTTTSIAPTTTSRLESTTTAIESTTTVTVLGTTTVTVAPSTTPGDTTTTAVAMDSTTPSTLPFTGIDGQSSVIAALVAMVTGAALVAITTTSDETHPRRGQRL